MAPNIFKIILFPLLPSIVQIHPAQENESLAYYLLSKRISTIMILLVDYSRTLNILTQLVRTCEDKRFEKTLARMHACCILALKSFEFRSMHLQIFIWALFRY